VLVLLAATLAVELWVVVLTQELLRVLLLVALQELPPQALRL
jgi:hypothetical protein